MSVVDVKPSKVHSFELTAPGVTPWVKLKTGSNPFEVTLAITGNPGVTGLDAKLEYVITDQEDPDTPALLPAAIVTHPKLTGVTAHADDKLEWPASHVRMNVNTVSVQGVKLLVLQPGAA